MEVGQLIRISKLIKVCGEVIQPGTITRVAGVFSGGILPVCAVVKHGKFGSGRAYCEDRFEPLVNVKDNWTDRVKVGSTLMALVDFPLSTTIKAGQIITVGGILNGNACYDGFGWPIERLREWFAPIDGWQHPTAEDIKVGDKLRVRAGFDRSIRNPDAPPDLKEGDVAMVCDVNPDNKWQLHVDHPSYWSFNEQFLWNVELVKDEPKPWHERVTVGMWLKVVGDARKAGIGRDALPTGSMIQVVEVGGAGFRTTGIDGKPASGGGGMWHWIDSIARAVLAECDLPPDGMEGIAPEFAWLRTIQPGDKLEVLDTEYHYKIDQGTVVEFIGILEDQIHRRKLIENGGSFDIAPGGGAIQVNTKLPDGRIIAGRYALRFKPVQRAERREPTHRETLRELIKSRLLGAI